MANDNNSPAERKRRWKTTRSGGTGDFVYFLAFLGAVVYFIEHATSFWNGVIGFLKAIIWPAILVYKALERLGM